MIHIKLDPTNPGQFFACCGLLELADRIWPGTKGWFEKNTFCLLTTKDAADASAIGILGQLADCVLTNTMTTQQVVRLGELSAMKGHAREKTSDLDEEKKLLEKLRREGPILLHAPFHLRLDWFQDDSAGGSRFKTWAGQQSVLDIASSMKKAIEAPDWRTRAPDEWLSNTVRGCGLPFNFDSHLGGQGSALDIGFSFDPLAASATTRIESTARPCLELLAFIGLQRFRPRQLMNDNRYVYCTWNQPLPPELAAPAACGVFSLAGGPLFEFRLLYRTKYLKSFLPAIPYFGGSDE
jgi:CRISPR-associated protein Csb3